MYNDFNDFANSALTRSKLIAKDFSIFQKQCKYGQIRLLFKYDKSIFNAHIRKNDLQVFYKGMIQIKYGVFLIWSLIYLFMTKDFYFLLILPASMILGAAINLFWHYRRIITLLISILIIAFGIYFEINWQYYSLLVFLVILSSIIRSIYNSFLREFFLSDEVLFIVSLEKDYIKAIFDKKSKKMYKGPFKG